MNQQGNPKTRRALVIAVILNGILAIALLNVWWRSHHTTASQPASQDSSQTAAESGANNNPSRGEAGINNEPTLSSDTADSPASAKRWSEARNCRAKAGPG